VGSGWFLLGPQLLRDAEYKSTWNGFSWLVTSFVREGRKTVDRLRSYGNEYEDSASDLEEVVSRWHSYGMGEIVEREFATA
jgi:hypothetical protein